MNQRYGTYADATQEGTVTSATYASVSIQGTPDSDCVLDQSAPVRRLFGAVGDKWALLAIYALADGPARFNALERRLPGVSQKVLAETLRRLERSGLVSREVFAEVPPRVQYELTDLGRTLQPLLDSICAWSRMFGQKLGQGSK